MLSEAEISDLDRLVLTNRISIDASARPGLRRRTGAGAGFDFQDYRPYEPGDDLRRIDWTLDARHRQLVVRLFRAEGRARVHVLLDISRSMTGGAPSKLTAAARLAAALSYVAIRGHDAAGVTTFDDACREQLAEAGGRAQLLRIFEFLAATRPGGRSALDAPLMAFAEAARGPGLAVIVSDFFQPDSSLDGVRYLLYRGWTPALVQVLADDEREPRVTDSVELVDVEDPAAQRMTVTPAAVAGYHARLRRLTESLATFCATHHLPLVYIAASASFEDMLGSCARGGLLGPCS